MSRAASWARRKAQVAAEERAEAEAEAIALRAEREAALATRDEAEILEELGLPDPDTLGPGDDFSLWMREVVPEYLRRRALKVLWRSNPVLANVDGLVDYGEDFTDAATVVENMQTTYQVGKGMLKHVIAQAEAAAKAEADAEAAELAAAEQEAAEPVETDPEDTAAAPEMSENDEEQSEVAFAATTPQADPEPAIAPRRRMKFTYEGDAA